MSATHPELIEDRLHASRGRAAYAFVALPLLTFAFFVIDHTWKASEYVTVTTVDFDGSENRTADRLESVNSGSSSMRLVLAAFGLLGLMLPSDVRFGVGKPITWAIASYYGWLFLSLLWSVDLHQTAFKLSVVAVFLLSALGLSRQLSFRQLAVLFCGQTLAYFAIGLFAEVVQGNFTPWQSEYRFIGTVHPNTCAAFAAVICMSSMLFFDRDSTRRTRLLTLGVFAIGLSMLLMTKSRTALASTVLAIVAIQGLRTRGAARLFLISGGVAALTLGTLFFSFLGARAQTKLGSAAAMGRDENLSTLTGRVPLWEELITQISDKPLFGHGYLGFWSADQVEYLGDVFQWEIPHGHNMYLDVMLDGGIIGLFLFLTVFFVGIVTAIWTFNRTHDKFVTLVFGVLLFAMLHGMGESFFKMMTFPNFMLTTLLLRLTWRPE